MVGNMTIKTKNLERQDVNSATLNPIEMGSDLIRSRGLLREVSRLLESKNDVNQQVDFEILVDMVNIEISSWE